MGDGSRGRSVSYRGALRHFLGELGDLIVAHALLAVGKRCEQMIDAIQLFLGERVAQVLAALRQKRLLRGPLFVQILK